MNTLGFRNEVQLTSSILDSLDTLEIVSTESEATKDTSKIESLSIGNQPDTISISTTYNRVVIV